MGIRVTDQPNEQETEKQGAEEVIGAILIGDNAEIRTLLLSGQFQVDFIVGGNIAYLLSL